MKLRREITVTVDRKRYSVDYGTITLIATSREHNIGGSPRERVFAFRDLRATVAKRLGTDVRTAHWILHEIKYNDLFTA